MARRKQADGFALAEMIAAVFVLAVLTAIAAGFRMTPDCSYLAFSDQYLRQQSEAILKGERVVFKHAYENSLPEITFNEDGNISQARTLQFSHKGRQREIVMELGGGRLVFR